MTRKAHCNVPDKTQNSVTIFLVDIPKVEVYKELSTMFYVFICFRALKGFRQSKFRITFKIKGFALRLYSTCRGIVLFVI